MGLRHLRSRAAQALRLARPLWEKAALLLPRRRDVWLCQRAARAAGARDLPALHLPRRAAKILRVVLHPGSAQHRRACVEAPRRPRILLRPRGELPQNVAVVELPNRARHLARNGGRRRRATRPHARSRDQTPPHVRRSARRISQRRHRFQRHRSPRSAARPAGEIEHVQHRVHRPVVRRIQPRKARRRHARLPPPPRNARPR